MASESASSSSITSQLSHTIEEMNKKENEEKIPNPDSNNIDFVKLSIENSAHGKKVQEYDFFGPTQAGSSSLFPNNNNEGKDENNTEENNSEIKYYSCVYCKGQYSSLQALGGHQNAHKQERALQKQSIKPRYDGVASGSGNPLLNGYLNYRSAFSPYNYNPLGVRMESMIQKPPHISPRFGHGGFCYQGMLHPSLVSLRDNIQGSGVASLGLGGATTSRIEDEVGRNRRLDDAMLKLAESSAKFMASTSTMAGIHNTKSNIEEEKEEEEDSSGLDLTLKL